MTTILGGCHPQADMKTLPTVKPKSLLALLALRSMVGAVVLATLGTGCTTVPTTDAPASAGSVDATAADAVREFDPDDLYRLLVAEIAAQRGELQLAVDNYLFVAMRTRDAGVAERAVRQAMYSGDENKSLRAAKLWTEVSPDDLTARQIYGALLLRAGQTNRAVEQFEVLLSGDDGEQGFDLMSELLSRERDRDKAFLTMGRLVQGREANQHALFAYARMAARAGELDRAIELTEQLLQIAPEHERAALFYARVLQQNGDVTRALESLSKTLARAPDSKAVRMTYARLLVEARRYEAALEQFEVLVVMGPEDSDIRYALGLLLMQTNRFEEAKIHFEVLHEFSEHRITAYYYLGQIAERGDRLDEAIEYYRRVDRDEHYLNAQIRVAVILAEQDQIDEARVHLHGVSRGNDQQDIRVYRAEAEILTNYDRLEEAMQVYDQALTAHAHDTDLLYARAMLAEKLDRLDLLERDLRDILSREPDNADALNALGFTLADRTDRYEEAIEFIQQAINLKPDDYYIIDSMGWVLYRVGRHQEALTHLRRAYELSGDAEVAAHLGEVLWVTGDQEGAREIWDTALKSRPDDVNLLEVIERLTR